MCHRKMVSFPPPYQILKFWGLVVWVSWEAVPINDRRYSDRHYSDKHYSDVHYSDISEVYWCRSSSPSPVCFNVDTDAPLNTRRSRAFPVAAARAWNALHSSAIAKTIRRAIDDSVW